MKKHDIYDVMNNSMDETWVPASVAQALYDALRRYDRMYVRDVPVDHRDYSVVMNGREALSLADGGTE